MHTTMLRRLFLLVMAIWFARLARMVQARPARRMSGFDPADGGHHPGRTGAQGPDGAFSPHDVVDGEFEDVSTGPKP